MTELTAPLSRAPDAPDDTPSRPRKAAPLRTQFTTTALGEMTSVALAIGAVYAADLAFPKKTAAFVDKLAHGIAGWRKTSAAAEQGLAKTITDVGLMNIGGAASFGVQYGLRRNAQKEANEALGLKENPVKHSYEVARLLAGMLGGTAIAISGLALTRWKFPGIVRGGEAVIAGVVGDRPGAKRFSEVAMNNLIQLVGAVPGNAAAQLLFDRVVDAKSENVER
ncbi:MAG: hypothetical protein ACKVOE_03180 [Rickettsiales bacterium]